MKIIHRTTQAGPNGVIPAGAAVDVPPAQALDLYRARIAVPVDPADTAALVAKLGPRTASVEAPETATATRRAGR